MNESLEITSEYKCLLAKLEELLRQYKIAKKNDKQNTLQERVKIKLEEIKSKLKTFPPFSYVEEQYEHRIDLAFREAKPQPLPNPKPLRQNVEAPKPKPQQPPKRSNALSSVSSYSSNSSQSNPGNQINNSFQSAKKQPLVVQQKIKTPLPVEKPKTQIPSIAKLLKEEPQKISQTPKAQTQSPKIDPISDSLSSKSSIKQDQIKKQGSISTIQKNEKFSQKQKSQGSFESQLSFLNENESQKGYTFNLKPKPSSEQKVETPQAYVSSQSQNDDFEKLSEGSVVQNTIETIIKFCCDNKEKLNTQLQFNEDLFDYIHEEETQFVYLFGVNKPEGKKMQKLFACTIMKFSVQEVFKCDDLFQKQTRDFKNNIRTPIGLIIKGDNASAIKPEHIKFLINLQCPFITVLVLKDLQQYDGVLCYFHQSALGRIRITPRKQLGQCADQLNKKTYALPFNQSYLPKEKTRYVITKHLNRVIATIPQQAPNAIAIQNNQCIREQKNQFNFKLHSKFLVSTKPQYAIYYVNNGIVNARIGYKQFEAFKKDALTLQAKVPAIFSVNVQRDNIPIKKEFFDVLVSCNKVRDPSIFLNLNNINTKKTIIITLKSDVTIQMLEKIEPIQYKNFQKDTQISYCLLVIHKNNFKEYEADGKNELIQLKVK